MIPFLVSFIPFLFIYLFTANQVFSFDAITNAIACESNEPLRWFHPNHLFYPSLGVLWYRIEVFFGYKGYAVYSLARFNSLLMACALGLLTRILWHRLGRLNAVAVSFFLGTTYAAWAYAVDGRAIGTTAFFAICLAGHLLSLDRKNKPSPPDVGFSIFFSTLYTASHAIAVFHIIPVTLFLFKKNKKYASLYFGGTILFVGTLYLLTYLFFIDKTSPFLSWALGYAGHLSAPSAMKSSFWSFDIRNILEGLWAGWRKSLVYGPMFISHLIGLICAAGVLMATRANREGLSRLFLQWGAGIMIFLAFWSPGQEGFRLHVLVPWLMATALTFSKHKYFPHTAFSMAALFFALNLTGPIYHNAFIQNNQGYQLLLELRAHLNPHDLFISAKTGVIPNFEVLRPYFSPEISGGTLEGRLLAFNERSLTPLKIHFDEKIKKGNEIYLCEDLFEEDIQNDIERRFELNSNAISSLIEGYKMEKSFQLSSGQWVYKIND